MVIEFKQTAKLPSKSGVRWEEKLEDGGKASDSASRGANKLRRCLAAIGSCSGKWQREQPEWMIMQENESPLERFTAISKWKDRDPIGTDQPVSWYAIPSGCLVAARSNPLDSRDRWSEFELIRADSSRLEQTRADSRW